MPRVIPAETDERIELDELVELLETGDFDAADEDNFASWGPMLKKLANNRDFLADMMIAELKDHCAGQVHENAYGAAVVMLHNRSKKFIMRANMWPALNDSIVKHSGTDPFFYHIPHDHNFSFLTVGYLGPGYWSDYYEYDCDQVLGVPDEPVDLKFIEKSRLDQGKVMLYRAHRDVHRQLPADAMSVSLNILEGSPSTAFRDQYRFDIENRKIAGVMNRISLEPMMALAAHFGGGNGADLIDQFASGHPSDRVRWYALRARAGAAPDLDARIAVFEEGARSDSILVGAMAKREVERLGKNRAWIEKAPAGEDQAAA